MTTSFDTNVIVALWDNDPDVSTRLNRGSMLPWGVDHWC
jgi:hypothetical protein